MRGAFIKGGVRNDIINNKVDELGYNYAILARRTGIYQAGVSRLLRGKREWRVDQLKIVLSVLGLDPEDVFENKKMLDHYVNELRLDAEWHSSQTNVAEA